MLAAACVALFSFSGLTGCGGGGGVEGGETYGMVTPQEFVRGAKGFYLAGGQLRIMPIGKSNVQAGDPGYPSDDPHGLQTQTVQCKVYVGSAGSYIADVIYRFEWPAGDEYPTAGRVDDETYMPVYGTCLMLPTPTDTGLVAALTTALGAASENTKLTGSVGIAIDYANASYTAKYTLWMQNDAGKYAPYPGQSSSGPIFAERQ